MKALDVAPMLIAVDLKQNGAPEYGFEGQERQGMLEMLKNTLIATATVAAALIAIYAAPIPAQALPINPAPLPVEMQTSSNVELAAARGRRLYYSNRGGYRGGGYGRRHAYRGGGYGRRYAGYGRRYYGRRYAGYRRGYYGRRYAYGYPWWGYGAVGIGLGYGGYYGGYGYGGDYGYGDDYGYGGDYGNGGSHVQWCLNRYRSYDPRTDTFMGYDGYRHRCRGPY